MIDIEKKYDMQDNGNNGKLDLSQLDLEVDVPDIDQYPNEQYALFRKHGLGTSDSSILLGVNPYTSFPELIEEKCRDYLTQEELEVGNKTAVRKGRDLEPVIIQKFSHIIGKNVIKPTDMYRHKDFPWIKFNYDGVIDKLELSGEKYQYIPAEIKVVTMYGQKHYDPTKAWYRQSQGFLNVPDNYGITNNSIATKAALYGIPPYYYTQLQQEIFGLNAKFGYLTVMFDRDWEVVSYLIFRDDACIQELITKSYQAWELIMEKTGDPNRNDTSKLIKQFKKVDSEQVSNQPQKIIYKKEKEILQKLF